MKHFTNITSIEDLKAQYKALALENHPDMGGNTETMQAINNEYDQLFPIWKNRSVSTNNETAASTRSEFYTQNGWKGENYSRDLSLKEIACIIREFIKTHYNHCKFSVTTSYASMCQELHISLMESPYRAYKTFDELTEEELENVRRDYTHRNNITTGYYINEIHAEIEKVFTEQYGENYLTDEVKSIIKAVEEYANSFNFDDSDSMIDYFHTNFYFMGVKVGKWNKPYKVVERTKKNVAKVEYENVEVTKTRTKKVMESQEITKPEKYEIGQRFILKSSFNYGCHRGYVYQITYVGDHYISAHKMDKKLKKVCTGDVRGNSFSASPKNLDKYINSDSISFVELVEVTKTEEYTTSVRRAKKPTESTAITIEGKATEESQSAAEVNTTTKTYTITPDTDTRDGSELWVVNFPERMDKKEYTELAAILRSIKGHYSRFKKGFIFRYDPTEKLEACFC